MDSPIVAAFIRSAVLPAFSATVVMFMFGFLKDPWRTRLQGLTLALAFMAGAYFLVGRLHVPPSGADESFSWSALLLAVFLVISPRPLGPRFFVRALFVLALYVVVLYPLKNTILAPVYYRNLIAFFCLALGVWSITEKAANKVRPTTLILLPLIAATGLSVILLFAASASYSQLVSIACTLFGGALVLALFQPKKLSVNALLPYLSVFVVMMMVAGHFYLDINPWHMIYLCFPYLILWIREWFSFLPQNPIAEGLVLGAVSAAPVAYFVSQA